MCGTGERQPGCVGGRERADAARQPERPGGEGGPDRRAGALLTLLTLLTYIETPPRPGPARPSRPPQAEAPTASSPEQVRAVCRVYMVDYVAFGLARPTACRGMFPDE